MWKYPAKGAIVDQKALGFIQYQGSGLVVEKVAMSYYQIGEAGTHGTDETDGGGGLGKEEETIKGD